MLDEISKDVKMVKCPSVTRDVSLDFSHVCMHGGSVSITVTSSGTVIIHAANEIFFMKDLVVKEEVIEGESGTLYKLLRLK